MCPSTKLVWIRNNSLCYVVYNCYVFIFIFFGKLKIVIANLGYVVVSLDYATRLVLGCYVVIHFGFSLFWILVLIAKLVCLAMLAIQVIWVWDCYVSNANSFCRVDLWKVVFNCMYFAVFIYICDKGDSV